MSKHRKPFLVRLIYKLLGFVLSLAIICGIGYGYIRIKYDVDLFSMINQIKVISSNIDESVTYPYVFTINDKSSAKDTINDRIPNLIKERNNVYSMSSDGVLAEEMSGEIALTGRQCGALLDMFLGKQSNIVIKIAETEMPFSIIQANFTNYKSADKSVNFEVVLKLDTTKLKETMTQLPASLIKRYIPDNLYVAATVLVQKGDSGFAYTVSGGILEINGLSATDTENVLKLLNRFVSFGDCQTLARSFAEPFFDALVGTFEHKGFAYSLDVYDAIGFEFRQFGNQVYFVIEK